MEPKKADVEIQSSTADTNTYMVLGSKFEVEKRYEIIDPVGSGAYGVVVAAKDLEAEDQENNLVAIKKIEKAFEHKVFAQRTLRELKIMRLLQHDNVIGIKTILKPKSRKDFNEIYVVNELMETDLAQIIKSNQPLSDDHIQFFLYQILRGLKYIHSAGILHRDLKPRNLLVNSNCDLKICDFGLARADIPYFQTQSAVMTDYIATRWYRAPEVILSWKRYSTAIDVWSVGCILAELITRKPLLPATSEEEQIQLITDLIGNPQEDLVEQITIPKNKDFIQSLPKRKGKDFNTLFKGANPDAIDLIKKMLAFDPSKRITIDQALEHSYMSQLHFPDDEPTCDLVSAFDFDFELYSLKKEDYKDLIYDEIMLYHNEDTFKQYIKDKQENPEGVLFKRYGKDRIKKKFKK